MAVASRNYLIDSHPSCYNVALIRGWARRIMLIRGVTDELDEAIFDFAAEVRGAAHSARLPLEIIRVMQASFETMIRDVRSETPTEKLANYFTINVGRKIPSLTVEQLNDIRGICLDLRQQFIGLKESPQLEFPLMKTWDELLTTGQFKLAVWGLERTSYVAVYNAYESFTTRCLALVLNPPASDVGALRDSQRRCVARLAT
jgi:hypothetical protein